jgi:hypothetical protein
MKFRPTHKSLLKGFLENIETHHGPDNDWGCKLICYDAIPNLRLKFQLVLGKLKCGFTNFGSLRFQSGEEERLFQFLERNGVDLNQCI